MVMSIKKMLIGAILCISQGLCAMMPANTQAQSLVKREGRYTGMLPKEVVHMLTPFMIETIGSMMPFQEVVAIIQELRKLEEFFVAFNDIEMIDALLDGIVRKYGFMTPRLVYEVGTQAVLYETYLGALAEKFQLLNMPEWQKRRSQQAMLIAAGLKDDRKQLQTLLAQHVTSDARQAIVYKRYRKIKLYRTLLMILIDSSVSTIHYDQTISYLETIKFLLENGANPNAQDVDGDTPLLIAARRGLVPVVKLLLERGAQPCFTNKKGLNALHIVCKKRTMAPILKIELLDILLKAGTPLNERDNVKWYTPLVYAVRSGHKEVVQFLLNQGANPCIQSSPNHPLIAHNATRSREIWNLLCEKCPEVRPANSLNAASLWQKIKTSLLIITLYGQLKYKS
jgi:hypothetical protein